MIKSQVISYINSKIGVDKLKTRNTTFANKSVSGSRVAWWMNIKLENFEKNWNIILVEESEFLYLNIPANTFKNPEKYFRVWDEKNAVNLVVSSDRQDGYLKDTSSGGTEVDFKPFIVKRFPIPEKMQSSELYQAPRSSRLKPEVISFTSVPKLHPEVRRQRIISQNQTNVSYEKLFGSHLKGADNIKLQDPWIRMPYQFNNLLEFCVMLGNNNNEPGRTINLKVVSWNTEEFIEHSKDCFNQLGAAVKEMRINLTFVLEQHHDRFIEADNGYKIVLGRGLDIFEKREGRFSIGDVDQRWRKCKACEITYIKMAQ
ncbi:MIT C-terminal domain-containing protein [Salinimicrobium sp. HB62]|uniref:MIT C-terminal domain-containing protein n=1 Tax=Salinimicrobium sp. HB62 TaxID=3077781 RepID=UPI002D785C48|nr:MIT C-terminal domain-containing protein [Salinimicrobium sp. HB62]